MAKDFLLFTFSSTHAALRFETVAKDTQLEVELIPVPREISASCGIAAKTREGQDLLEQICLKEELEVSGLYKVCFETDSNLKRIIKQELSVD